MAIQRHILLGFPQAVGINDIDGVLLSLNRALLQCGQRIGPCHRSSVHIHSLEAGRIDVILHNADRHAGKIRCCLNRLYTVGQIAEATFCISQTLQTGILQSV